jgi:hypothetical protein
LPNTWVKSLWNHLGIINNPDIENAKTIPNSTIFKGAVLNKELNIGKYIKHSCKSTETATAAVKYLLDKKFSLKLFEKTLLSSSLQLKTKNNSINIAVEIAIVLAFKRE